MLKTIAEAFAQKVQERIQKPVDENLLKELLNKLLTKLNSEYIYPDYFLLKQFADNKIFLELEIDGDWKHDHLYCEHLVKNFCEENNIEILSVEEEVYHEEEETSYSDDYAALHTWELFIEANLEENLINEEQLEETYSDDELNRMVGKVYNIRKLDKWYRNDEGLFAHTICTKCGREKDVFLSNLINDPDKYGSCICSDENIDAKIDYAQKLYTGGKKLSSNTSGYTGVSFVKNYKGQPYNKWRAYIEVDGKRTYLGDFTKKKDAVKARKVAAEKGVKWYKENKNKITRDLRRKTKKYTTSKYRDSKRKIINLKENASDYVPSDEFKLYTAGYILENGSYITLDEYHAEEPEFRNKKLIEFSSTHFSDDVAIRIYKQPTEAQYKSLEKVIDSFLDEYLYCKLECEGNGPILYKAYCLYENAVDDDGYTEQVIGNWTGWDLIKIIKKYYQNNEDLILKEK